MRLLLLDVLLQFFAIPEVLARDHGHRMHARERSDSTDNNFVFLAAIYTQEDHEL